MAEWYKWWKDKTFSMTIVTCAVALALGLFFLLSSCTATEYTDIKGEWHSTTEAFSPFADFVVLDITDNEISVTVDNEEVGRGGYRIDRGQAIMGWSVEMHSIPIVLYDATMTADEHLLLRWKPLDYYYNFTGIFER